MHRRSSASLALACLIATACGGGGRGSNVPVRKPIGPAVDEKTAEKDAKGLAEEILETLDRGNKDSLFSLLDNSLIVFGPHRGDAASNRTDALVALGQYIDPKTKKKLVLRSTSLAVVASKGGRSAWAFDIINVDGQPHAITAILVNTNDLWQVQAAVVAFTPAKTAIKSELAKDAVVPPGAAVKSKIDPDARGAVDRFQKGLLDQELWGADLASRSDAIVIGPSSGEVTRGKQDIKKLWKQRVDAKTRAIVSGELVAAVTSDGQLAWVSAPITRVAEGEDPTPLRAFAVFEKAGGEWKMIALHESVAFDEPGGGTRFKKILPPVPKPEVMVAATKDDPKDTKKETKKATKKETKKETKKASADDEQPKKKKKKTKPVDDDVTVIDDDPPKKKKKTKKAATDEDDPPKKKKTKKTSDDEDDPPKKKTKKPADDEDDPPKKKKKKPVDDE